LRDLSFRVLGKCNCSNPLAQEPARLSCPSLVIQPVHIILNILIILISFLILSKFFIYQLMFKTFALKEILKFTLKMLRHVSVKHHHQGAYYLSFAKVTVAKTIS